jgi:hypothetical protein
VLTPEKVKMHHTSKKTTKRPFVRLGVNLSEIPKALGAPKISKNATKMKAIQQKPSCHPQRQKITT